MRLSLVTAALLLVAPTAARADVFNMPSGQTSVSMVTIGDPGNAADTGGTVGDGAVNYVYKIDAYKVTTAQYTQFLNAIAKADTYNLWNSNMSGNYPTFGITRSGSSGSYAYSVKGNGNAPIFSTSWGDAARFCNWLQNGQPTGAEGNGTTETGAYTLNGAVSQSALMAIARNAGATYVIPTENEWYKAAYYKGGGTNAGYWTYATQSNSVPSNVLSASGTNNANYYDNGYTDPVNELTPVGAFASSLSAYGTYDQTGNLFEWNEANIGGSSRGMRGGVWNGLSGTLPSSFGIDLSPTNIANNHGFRVAEVTPVPAPEPSSFALAAIGMLVALGWIARRRASR